MGRRAATLIVLVALGLAGGGCATSTVLAPAEKPRPVPRGARILVMEPDVQLYEMTAAGLLEPKADWTEAARDHIGAALGEVFTARDVVVVPYAPPTDASREHAHVQLVKLHERVGASIIVFRYGPVLRLAGKGDVFDWSLGETARVLADDSGADYALFVRFLDSYASAGRVATMVAFAVLGVGLPGGTQVGFGSLVDLKTGDIVWFNRLVDPAGDLRSPEPARKAVRALLEKLPL